MPPDVQNSLSQRLLGLVLLAAMLLGLLFCSAQIAHDLQRSRQAIRAEGRQLLDMFREAASLAGYRDDRRLAEQVVNGLLQHPGVQQARLLDSHGEPLADSARDAGQPPDALGEHLFGPPQAFALHLRCPTPRQQPCGELAFTLDSRHQAESFFATTRFLFASSLAFLLLLGLALSWLCRRQLSAPLAHLLGELARIDPERPGEHQLPPLRGHERDELGQWVARANQLLAAIARHHSRRREAESNLQRMSQFDQLTGLPARPLLQQQLERLLRDAERSQGRVAVLCLGLDDFNSLNEQYGYQAGDRLLAAVAERLRALDSRLACLARLGGDQFALVQIAFEHSYEVAELAQQVLDELARPLPIGGQQIRLAATIGITLFPDDGDGERLLQRAEQTLTLAKQGRGQRRHVQFFVASLDREIRRRRQLEQDLRRALHDDQLELYYQPQLCGAEQRVVGVEALLRWRHPQLGFVPPDQFIPLAEQSGLILEIGDWVLERACRQLRDWHAHGLAGLRMAVNLSTAQLRSEQLPRQVLGLLQRHGLPPYSLELEVTETGLMTNVRQAAQQLNSLRLAKVLLAVDDFGTGYSSLSYLKSLPLDKIKIDRSFVRDLPHNEDDAVIARTIIQLAHNLGMQVIAEGVENAAQEAYLLAHGCSEGQGYLYCRPLPAFEVTQYLSNAMRRAALGAASPPLGRLG